MQYFSSLNVSNKVSSPKLNRFGKAPQMNFGMALKGNQSIIGNDSFTLDFYRGHPLNTVIVRSNKDNTKTWDLKFNETGETKVDESFMALPCAQELANDAEQFLKNSKQPRS